VNDVRNSELMQHHNAFAALDCPNPTARAIVVKENRYSGLATASACWLSAARGRFGATLTRMSLFIALRSLRKSGLFVTNLQY
jgi:hypothetical protein